MKKILIKRFKYTKKYIKFMKNKAKQEKTNSVSDKFGITQKESVKLQQYIKEILFNDKIKGISNNLKDLKIKFPEMDPIYSGYIFGCLLTKYLSIPSFDGTSIMSINLTKILKDFKKMNKKVKKSDKK